MPAVTELESAAGLFQFRELTVPRFLVAELQEAVLAGLQQFLMGLGLEARFAPIGTDGGFTDGLQKRVNPRTLDPPCLVDTSATKPTLWR